MGSTAAVQCARTPRAGAWAESLQATRTLDKPRQLPQVQFPVTVAIETGEEHLGATSTSSTFGTGAESRPAAAAFEGPALRTGNVRRSRIAAGTTLDTFTAVIGWAAPPSARPISIAWPGVSIAGSIFD